MEEDSTVPAFTDFKTVSITDDTINEFRADFQGQIFTPDDLGYDDARKIWNAHIDRYPRIIARCSGVADVMTAINFSRQNNLLVAVRGGGHNVGGRALCDGGLVIDLSAMKSVHVDSKKRVARVQGGATLGDVDRETHVFGLAVPAGVMSETGIGGLTLGGGVGWLVRKYGMTCDNVISFEVVTADGQLLVASSEENEDLFWGLRGGGGNFGVVTSFEFRLHPVNVVLGGLILYPREHAEEVLKFYRDFTQSAPDEITAYAALLNTPDGIPAVAIIACYCGDLVEGEKVIKPLREFGSPLVDALQPMPFPVMQKLLNGACPNGNQNYWKSCFLSDLSSRAIEVLIDHANKSTSPLSVVIIEYYGGLASRIGISETAFSARQEEYSAVIMGQWSDPTESAQHIQWTRNLAEALQPFSSGAFLLNALGEEKPKIIKAAFGPNYDRLVTVKKKYDPSNFFRFNQNIDPQD